jgi:cytoskeletal protein CcmA (bactofilin family)
MADLAQQDIPTVLGPDSNFKGELSFDKGVRVHGRFEGKITSAGRLHVAKEARMQAEVDAGSIVIEGELHGRASAVERVELKASARYEGDLKAPRMLVEEGAVFSGHVCVGPDVVKGTTTPAVNGTPRASASSASAAAAASTVPIPASLTR